MSLGNKRNRDKSGHWCGHQAANHGLTHVPHGAERPHSPSNIQVLNHFGVLPFI